MLDQPLDTPQHDAYLALAQRIQDAIASDKPQIEHQVLFIREPGESVAHWDRLIDQISESEGITVTLNSENGTAHVSWYI
ncbi:DUF1654 domain-containing protein, partial [Pseudomonas syringae pv. tagetis]|uniref:DUF1654 domain-containing protein n=1 Tax=Pseudomonas syringae group genomosp. 7 TaxID=251699 RepID=UPI0037702CE0